MKPFLLREEADIRRYQRELVKNKKIVFNFREYMCVVRSTNHHSCEVIIYRSSDVAYNMGRDGFNVIPLKIFESRYDESEAVLDAIKACYV